LADHAVKIMVFSLIVTLGLEDFGDGGHRLAAEVHVVFQVVEFKEAAELFGDFDDFFGDTTGVETCFTFFA